MGQPLALAVADLDHFKIVNDCMGHRVGDEVLRRSANIMQRHCRPVDLVARIGGEEFAFIPAGLDLTSATVRCRHCAARSNCIPGPQCIPACG